MCGTLWEGQVGGNSERFPHKPDVELHPKSLVPHQPCYCHHRRPKNGCAIYSLPVFLINVVVFDHAFATTWQHYHKPRPNQLPFSDALVGRFPIVAPASRIAHQLYTSCSARSTRPEHRSLARHLSIGDHFPANECQTTSHDSMKFSRMKEGAQSV